MHSNIQFPIETEKDGHLVFLDMDIYNKPDGSLGHKVYRKPTNTNLYFKAKSHHHPSNIQAVLNTLEHTARVLYDSDSLQDELEFLKITYKQNGYSDQQIHCVLYPATKTLKPAQKPTSVALLPFLQTSYGCLDRMLSRYNIKCVRLPPMMMFSFLHEVKDDFGLKTPEL